MSEQKSFFEIRLDYLTLLHDLNQRRIKSGLPILPILNWDENDPQIRWDRFQQEQQ